MVFQDVTTRERGTLGVPCHRGVSQRRRYEMRNDARRAFTLIEVLVVIAIIGMLAMLAVSSYGAARIQAQRDIILDTMVSALKKQQSLAKSGRINKAELSDDGASDAQNMCYGMIFSVEEPYAQYIEAPYVPVGENRADYCEVDNADLRDVDILSQFVLRKIERFGTEVEKIAIWFKPPFATINLADTELVIPDKVTATAGTMIHIWMGLPSDEESELKSFSFDVASGLTQRIYPSKSTTDTTVPGDAPTNSDTSSQILNNLPNAATNL